MVSQMLFLVFGMVLLTKVSSTCARNDMLKHMFTRDDLLVLCDHGRKIYVRKLSGGSLRIRVHDCKGNFNKFTVKALDQFYCRNGLEHTIVPHYQRSLASFSNAYSQLWQWYWYCHMCCTVVLRTLYIYSMYATQEKQTNK